MLATRLARGDTHLFRVGIYIAIHADNPAELAERVTEVRALAAGLLLDTAPATWRQLQGWTTACLPLAVDTLGLRRAMDTDALAAAIPVASPDLPITTTGSSVLFGVNLASAGAVAWDRWSCDNYNSVILARSGSGKSYLAKLDLLRNLFLGAEASVIDPEDEYLQLAHAVGGTIIRPGSTGVRINPLDLPVGEPDALVRQCLFLHTFLEVLDSGTGKGGLSADEAAVVDAAALAAYHTCGITTDPRTWRRPAPHLRDLAAALRDQGRAGQRLADRLRPYVSGSRRDLFDGHTTIRPEGHLVVYAIKDLPDELKPVVTLLTLNAIWRRIAHTQRRARHLVVVDEAWLLLRDGVGADWLFKLAKRSRKYGAGLSLVTQDVADVLATDLGRAIVSNAATQLLLRQAPQAIDQVCEAFGLTAGERAFLLAAGRGDALLSAGTHRVAFHAETDLTEHALITTDPEFLASVGDS